MEHGSIEREIHVDASPEVVYEVVSRPEHLSRWWTDDADFEPVPGAVGELVWGDRADVSPIAVVRAEPPRLFSFRWCHSGGKADDSADSLLVTFELIPSAGGTRIRLVETGFREMGWEAAKLAQGYQEHTAGWDTYIPRLGEYVARLVAAS
ncbi:SRPBCC domain-containing protein [Nonomuraea sp. MCN248]|uniref:SRPBCC domain-containing protein n=1 Tax=Nonomuraea corallina TaxID=2989783 RepID=A0ABT4S579_9ACTN|nr:SRPBCC domain-containing protein [Nonomuraea corallina]MDA0632354.1 SRPBCC domain-containing protein [Nonomuraea corallina]